MSKIVRQAAYPLQAEDGKSLRLKKWSAAKLFYLVKQFKSIVEEIVSGIDKEPESQIVVRVVNALIKFESTAVSIIEDSLDIESKMSADEIKELYPEDFIGVLTKIVELNITEELVKNFQKLLGSFEPGNKKPAPKTKGA